MKILIENDKDRLLFSVSKKTVPQEELNNTNVISSERIIFEDSYIKENYELISSFLKTLVIKKNLKNVFIKQNDIVPMVLKLIANIENLTAVYFLEAKPIYYDIVKDLITNYNITYLNCYSMPSFLFERLNIIRDITIEVRIETPYQSEFMNYNNLTTYSQIYYKRSIAIKHDLSPEDFNHLETFLEINTKLKIIELYIYSEEVIKKIFKLLEKFCISKIKIIIVQTGKDTIILNDSIGIIKKCYQKQIKKQSLEIKIRYNDSYKREMVLKQINFSLFKSILLIILSTSLVIFLVIKYEEKKAKNIVTELDEIKTLLEEEVILDDPFIEYEDEEVEEEEQKPDAYFQKYEKVFSSLLAINDDTIGWLTVKNTSVDYPVVQYSNNEYYLNHNFYKERNNTGWIYLDYRIDIDNLSQNNIIYGHKSGGSLMFGSLKKLLDKSWYTNESNHIITFNTLNKNLKWQIFSIYTIGVTNDYLISNFTSNRNFMIFIEREKERSVYDFNVEVTEEDKILTLSTCYNTADYRLVVHAKLLND